ncbi:hypothetical protein OUZ56_008429 [Daphnia magna]|uniref:Mitochondrial outer membrane transport complex Sam37/metaxin N-terminal domain-containing protein n=1 Tax=Daphnia magna TaxID=35525 RepID=A0ABR0AD31_9CRUS|nr:hypothetical protein OUZ56_008429 [Daphnia magna]
MPRVVTNGGVPKTRKRIAKRTATKTRNAVRIKMTYAKFSGTPLKTKITNNPFKTPHGSLPVFRHENECLTKFGEISAYLRKNNHTADFELSPKQCAEAFAYSHLIYEKLVPALKEIGYLFTEMSHPLLGQRCDRGEEIIGRSPL